MHNVPSRPIDVTIDYTYDSLYRLVAADYSNGDYFHYTYDSVGNRVSTEFVIDEAAPVEIEYTYDEANRLIEVDSVAYTWDDNGNLLSDGVSTYTYDSANRLTSVTQGTDVSVYNYNGLGDRLQQNFNNAPTNFTVDLNAGLTQVLADGTNSYAYGLDLLSQQSGASERYFLPDALGSTRQLTEQTSAITFSTAFDPYGNPIASDGGGSIFGYTGEQTDATGLVYLRARYYAPLNASFITADEFRGSANDPASLNRYTYAFANPIIYVDPDGKCPKPSSAAFASSSGGIFCIAAFIPTKYSEVIPDQVYYTGDGRDFSYDSDSSRIWMWIDASTGELIDYEVNKTCRANSQFEIVKCNDPRPVVDNPATIYQSWITVESNGNDKISVDFGIICNDEGAYGFLFCSLMFTGHVDITQSQEIITTSGVTSRFPNYEGWFWQNQNRVVRLFAIQNFSPEELHTGIGNFSTPLLGWATKTLFETIVCFPFGGVP